MTWDNGNGSGPTVAGAAGGSRQSGQLAAGAERSIRAPLTITRQHLIVAVRDLGFQLTTEQLTALEAVRGSKLGAVTLTPSRMPVGVQFNLETVGQDCRVTVRVSDRWPAKVGRNWGATSVYLEVFDAVLSTVDAVLARLDPAAAGSFTARWRDVGPGDVTAMQNAGGWAAQASSMITRHTTRLLDGDGPKRGAPVSRTGAGTFTFVAPERIAEVSTELADGMLTVGTLITSRPGQMPANLVSQIQSLVYRVEEQVAAAGATGADPRFRFTVDESEVPVVTFLHQQAQLREMLPVRTLQVCTTCKLEKIVNPELERLQERNRRTRQLATTVSAVVSPFVLAGRLAQTKGPAFACPRCQGMSADESVVTFCRQCGDRRAETALRSCSKCTFDFRSMLPKTPLWVRPDTELTADEGGTAAPPQPITGPPTPPTPPTPQPPQPSQPSQPATGPPAPPPQPATGPPAPPPAVVPAPGSASEPVPVQRATPVEESWPRPPGQ
ncbi:hypothetical protein ACN27F_05060 [Solwaraspora sp. WMMB335]|uniref:hypothetical protein n=1 Tax=Solwaraspora sp. WMMB335 TaxID=3404118 RepID=UPI003B94517D